MNDVAADHALLDAILAEPENDAPRLVYADWLLERRDVRGDFIVSQCAMARLEIEGRRASTEYRAARRRDQQLSEAARGWKDAIGLKNWDATFRRGFMAEVRISMVALRARWALFQRIPLETLRFQRRLTDLFMGPMGSPEVGRLAAFVRAPGTLRPRTIGIDSSNGRLDLDAAALADGLDEITADDETLTWEEDVLPHRALAGALTALQVHGRGGNGILASLAASPPPLLHTLRTRLSPSDIVIALVHAFPSLRALTLDVDRPDGAKIAHALSRLEALEELTTDVPLDASLARAIARAPRLRKLHCKDVTADGLAALAASDLPGRLTELRLVARTPIPFRGLALGRLETLALKGFAIDEVLPIANALVDLELQQCSFEAMALRRLVALPVDNLLRPSFHFCRLSADLTAAITERWSDASCVEGRG